MARIMKCKTKIQRTGKIDPSNIGSKRLLNCDFNLFVDLLDKANPFLSEQEYLIEKNTVPKVEKNEFGNFKLSNTTCSRPYNGKNGEIIFLENCDKPAFLKKIAMEAKSAHGLKDEAMGYNISIWPPSPKGKLIEYEIPIASMDVISRVVITVGNKEDFKFSVGSNYMGNLPKVDSVEGNIICFNNESFSLCVPFCSQLEIKFDNKNFIFIAGKDNKHRDAKLTRDPSKRFICVVDFIMNTELVANHVKSETMNRGQDKNISKTISDFSHLLGIKDLTKEEQELAKDVKLAMEELINDDVEDIPILVKMDTCSSSSSVKNTSSSPEDNI